MRTVELVEAHIGPLQTLMTSQGSQGAGTHMGVEGRSRDSAVFTGITHMWNLINERGECSHFNLHSAVTAFYNLKLATGWLSSTLLASAVFVWLLLPCFAFGPFQPNWSPVTLAATKGRKACGTRSSLHPGNFGQSPHNRCHHMPKQAVSQLHMVTLLEESPFFTLFSSD